MNTDPVSPLCTKWIHFVAGTHVKKEATPVHDDFLQRQGSPQPLWDLYLPLSLAAGPLECGLKPRNKGNLAPKVTPAALWSGPLS
jgi:hypothetical protein